MLTVLASAHRAAPKPAAGRACGHAGVRDKDSGGLTTLCLKPFMAVTGASARQAVWT